MSIRLESYSFIDERFTALGRSLYPDLPERHAWALGIGLMARVWEQCTGRSTYYLSREELDLLGGIRGFSDLVIGANLGEEKGVAVRLCGTKGRVEWLENAKRNGSKGGRPKKKPCGLRGGETTAEPNLTEPNQEEDPEKETPREALKDVLRYYTELTGRRARVTEDRIKAMKRILRDAGDVDIAKRQAKRVIWSKAKGPRAWLGDAKMDDYVTPETLFRASKFVGYLEQANRELKEQGKEEV